VSVQILYFAALAELAQTSEEHLELPSEVRNVGDFVRFVQRARPALAGKMASVRVALDENFAKDSDDLQGVQVIALIPPVAGG
jgi:molybdopterin converting factor subunit 1